MLEFFLYPLFGAFLFRVRGGFLVSEILPTFGGRLVWAIGMGLLFSHIYGFSSLSLLYMLGLYIGSLPGWYGGWDLGRRDNHPYLRDAFVLAIRGIWWTLPLLPLLLFMGLSPLYAFAGILALPSYELGWRLGKEKGPIFGEAIFGAVLGVLLLVR